MPLVRSRLVPRLVAALALVALAACGSSKEPAASAGASGAGAGAPHAAQALSVVAINAPLAYFVDRIAGGLVTVTMPVPADVDPAEWTPGTEDIAVLQKADLIVLNGAGLERWRGAVALPERKVVETADGFRSSWLVQDGGVTHSHGLEGEHTHAGTAFTTWIDPMKAIEQARAIKDALTRLAPERADDLASNYLALERDLRDLDGRYEQAISGNHALPLVFSHPVYEYFIERFALNARSVHWEPGTVPSDAELDALAGMLAEHPARWMIWEDEPGDAVRAKLRERGLESVVVAPAGNMGTDWSGWLERQRENAVELAKVYQ
jgi:zinc transport system substrate-binding protein